MYVRTYVIVEWDLEHDTDRFHTILYPNQLHYSLLLAPTTSQWELVYHLETPHYHCNKICAVTQLVSQASCCFEPSQEIRRGSKAGQTDSTQFTVTAAHVFGLRCLGDVTQTYTPQTQHRSVHVDGARACGCWATCMVTSSLIRGTH